MAKVPPAAPIPAPAKPEQPLAPDTTTEQNLISAGQRHINVKWESTQQWIALMVAFDALLICTLVIYNGDKELALAAFLFVTNLAFLVVGNYFQRTNHEKIGGVGAKPPDKEEYKGR